jgi:2-(acetamidomethylene)succinate hydrolase
MSDAPRETTYNLTAGRFRALEWDGTGESAVFLHGLSGVADVWQGTVEALGASRPRCIAIDQRGHGHSPKPGDYRIGSYVQDLADLVRALGGPVRLVGHSMGARVALVAAARHPQLFSSAAIVDIGPEAWKANIDDTVAAFSRRPERFADREEAIAFGSRGRRGSLDAERFLLPRLNAEPDGSYTWLAPAQGLVETVRAHRSRNFWKEWDAISIPATLVRGERSNELRPWVAARMRERNPRIEFHAIAETGHNIPLLAPKVLAAVLTEFWRRVGTSAT